MGDLAASAHTDHVARLFSPTNGDSIRILSGHADAVTAVAFDPWNQFELATGSHDGFLRVFDIRTMQPLLELALHQRKFDESLHGICHGLGRLVTCGADADIHVLVPTPYSAAVA